MDFLSSFVSYVCAVLFGHVRNAFIYSLEITDKRSTLAVCHQWNLKGRFWEWHQPCTA